MSLHLFKVPITSEFATYELRLLCGYENGGVTLWRYTRPQKPTSVEGAGWEAVWSAKVHVESGASEDFIDFI
jgi:ASTRA-associated protein 1